MPGAPDRDRVIRHGDVSERRTGDCCPTLRDGSRGQSG
jgi:hypothetical protein